MRSYVRLVGRGVALGFLVATPALASAAGGEASVGLWVALFLAFGALTVLSQAAPAGVLFASMVRGLFAPPAVQEEAGEESRKVA